MEVLNEKYESISCVCIGSGRFLRAVFVPMMVEFGCNVVVIQPRGTSFGDYMKKRGSWTYEVDTILMNGEVVTTTTPIVGYGTLGNEVSLNAVMELPNKCPNLRYIGVGITEAGITHNGETINHLSHFFYSYYKARNSPLYRLSVINTDNVPSNGSNILKYVKSCDFTQALQQQERDMYLQFLDQHITFHNTMVDRITGCRDNNEMIPSTEPLPLKALVIEDLRHDLSLRFESVPGIILRRKEGEIEIDHQLKLRIANAIHTAMVHVMALSKLKKTDACIENPIILSYIEQIFENDIVIMCEELNIKRSEVFLVYCEWTNRLKHPHFGLNTFWVSQNGLTKIGIRILPTIIAEIKFGKKPSKFIAFAVASVLRYLTPFGDQAKLTESSPVFRGKLDQNSEPQAKVQKTEPEEYSPGLHYSISENFYEFKDGMGVAPLLLRHLSIQNHNSNTIASVIAGDVLSLIPGVINKGKEWEEFVNSVGEMLHVMVRGKAAIDLLEELKPSQPLLLTPEESIEVAKQEVESVEAIDLHTHLFPSNLGDSMLWGIDDLLTYHYLVSEYFMTAKESFAEFSQLSKKEKATKIWEKLFVSKIPMSEACRGVITVLNALGLKEEIKTRKLESIREWFDQQNPQSFTEKMFRLSNVKYVVMTNDPFINSEAESWKTLIQQNKKISLLYKTSLCIDCLGDGDWKNVLDALKRDKFSLNSEGLKNFLISWINIIKPQYLTMSTSFDWDYNPNQRIPCNSWESSRPSNSEIIDDIVIPVCKMFNLPLAFRMGTKRNMNTIIQNAHSLSGDGVGIANLSPIERICLKYPKQKFLLTFLSRVNNHEICVLGTKFSNLHIFGCWWYCNTPSTIREITETRLELLGTNFSASASSARVHDQLIYKWIHAREVIGEVLGKHYFKLGLTGWPISRQQIRQDVSLLFGGSFEEFMDKSL